MIIRASSRNFIPWIIAIVYLLWAVNGKSQDFTWESGFHGFFDNREYFNEYSIPQTIFGARAYGQVGFMSTDRDEFAIGLNGLYEFGSFFDPSDIDPIIYYKHTSRNINLLLGSSNRKKLIDFPLVFLSDTLQYYRPNLEGIFLDFHKSWGSQNIWIDWTSRQTAKSREIFQIGGTGTLQKSILFYRHDFIMTHFAHTGNADRYKHIRDNGGFYIRMGLNLSKYLFADSLTLSTGFVFSYDRYRNLYPIEFYGGNITELYFEYRGLGIKSVNYFGDGQVQIAGDGLYKAAFYNRTDMFWNIFSIPHLGGKIQFSLHFIEDVLDVSQMFSVFIDLSGTKPVNYHPSSDH